MSDRINGNGNGNGTEVTLTEQRHAEPIQTTTQTQSTMNAQAQVQANAQQAQVNTVAGQEQMQRTGQVQTQENVSLWRRMMNRLLPAHVNEAAQGTPVQTQAPPTQTIKWYNRRSVETQIAQTHNSVANYISYEVEKQIQEGKKERAQARMFIGDDHIPESFQRYAITYAQGYKADEHHVAINSKEQKKMDQDRAFIEDFSSPNHVMRRSHLERITNEMLNVNFSMSMFEPKYLRKHAKEMDTTMKKFINFHDLYKDKDNQFYFNTMDPLKKQLVQTRILTSYHIIGSYYGNVLGTMGLSTSFDTYEPAHDAVRFAEASRTMANGLRGELDSALKDIKKKSKEIQKDIDEQKKNDKKAAKAVAKNARAAAKNANTPDRPAWMDENDNSDDFLSHL